LGYSIYGLIKDSGPHIPPVTDTAILALFVTPSILVIRWPFIRELKKRWVKRQDDAEIFVTKKQRDRGKPVVKSLSTDVQSQGNEGTIRPSISANASPNIQSQRPPKG
jgi:hypothetical protein